MSQLERLAEAIVQVGKQAGPVQQSITQVQQRIARLAPAVPDDEAGYARTIRTNLYAAGQALKDAERLLDDFDKQADAFAKRLVGNGAAGEQTGDGETADQTSGVASADDIREWIKDVNPGYSGSRFDPRSTNCGKCAHAVFDALSGKPVRDAGPGTYGSAEMARAIGRKQIPITSSGIATRLRSEGAGAHAVVGVDRQNGVGHWFNAYFDGQDVWAIDGQAGTVSGWPPDYGSPSNPVTYWDVSEK